MPRGRIAIFTVLDQIGHQHEAAVTIAAIDRAPVADLHIDQRMPQGSTAAVAGDPVLDDGDWEVLQP